MPLHLYSPYLVFRDEISPAAGILPGQRSFNRKGFRNTKATILFQGPQQEKPCILMVFYINKIFLPPPRGLMTCGEARIYKNCYFFIFIP